MCIKGLLIIVLEYSVYFSFFLGITGHWSSRVERAGVVSRVQMAGNVIEIALWEMTTVRPLNFIPEYRKYIRLGSLGANPDLC